MKKALINASVCLSDIPKGKMIKDKNEKIYIEIIVSAKKKDQYDNDVKVAFTLKEGEKEQYPNPFIGDGRWVSFAPESADCLPNQFFKGLLKLSDIPNELIREGKNSKKYLNITFQAKKEKPNLIYGIISQTEEQREAKEDKIYLFDGELFTYKVKPEDMEPVDDVTDLGW